MLATFPHLCHCDKRDGYVEHRSMVKTYVLWVLPDHRHVAFIHRDLLADGISNRGETFRDLILSRQSIEEPCKMISRPFLQLLGYKPDYIVIVDSQDESPTLLTSGFTMATILHHASKNPTMEHIRTLAEGPGEPAGPRNLIGQTLTHLSHRLSTKGFFADTKYFPHAERDMRCLASGMSLDELRLRKLFKVI
jgi:hypothetical protein